MSINVCELDCSYNSVGSDELFRSLITTTVDDCYTLRAETTTASDSSCNQFSCDMIQMGLEEIFRKLLFIDASGCLAARVVIVNTP